MWDGIKKQDGKVEFGRELSMEEEAKKDLKQLRKDLVAKGKNKVTMQDLLTRIEKLEELHGITDHN